MNPTTSPPASDRTPLRHPWWIGGAVLVWALVWLVSLGTRALISPDEGRYATLSLEMLMRGDWVTPHLNGLLYFEKPPLQYWGGALAMAVFGVNEFAARLWPGLAGLATVAMTGLTAGRLWGRTAGAYAFVAAAGTTWIVLNSHFLALDAGLTAALTLVLCAMLIAESPAMADAPQRRLWVWAAWAGMALAMLSKGLIGIVIPGAVLVLHSVWRLDFSPWRRMHWVSGLTLLLVIAAPWFVLVSLRNPDFAHFFFIHEHFERYLTTTHRREGAWWYFVPILLVGFMPWTSALPWLTRVRRADFADSLLLVWAVFIFAFFSASGSKLPSYILPMFPALVLLLAHRLATTRPRSLRLHLLVPTSCWVVALVVALQPDRFVSHDSPVEAVHALAGALVMGAALFLLAAVIAWVLLGRRKVGPALALVAGAHFCGLTLAMQAHDVFGRSKSSAEIAKVLASHIDADSPVYAVASYDQTLPFYLRRPVTLVDYRDEFTFGQDHEPARWIPTTDAFLARWRTPGRAAAYMTPTVFDALRARGMEARTVFADPRRIVVVKP